MDGLVAVSDRLCRRVGAAPSRQRLAKTGRRAGRGSLWFPCSGQDSGSRLEGISMGSGEARGETGKLLTLETWDTSRPGRVRTGAARAECVLRFYPTWHPQHAPSKEWS